MSQKVLGKEQPNTITTYNNIAVIYNNKKNYDLALEYYKKALKICEKVLGKENSYTIATYKNISRIYEYKGNYKEAVEYYRKAGMKNILEILVHFKEENREKIIKRDLLSDLLKNDPYFKSVIGNVKDVDKKYENMYIKSIYIISLLYINDMLEKEVAHYTKKKVAEEMLVKDNKNESTSKFRLNSINHSNDPKEGSVLLEFLFDNEIKINQFENPYRAFAGCFTFHHDNLNQFRLYGKEDGKECTGVSIVFGYDFFEKSAKLATQQIKNDGIKASAKEENKHALFRCIYIDPKTNKVISIGRKEEFLLYRDGKTEEKINVYNDKIKKLIEKVSKKLLDLKKHIECSELDKDIVFQLLINLRYLTKPVSFKEEQECRIIKIERLEDENVKMDESKRMYLEYLEISQYVEKIYFAPNTPGMKEFQDRLLNEDKRIECIKSENQFLS